MATKPITPSEARAQYRETNGPTFDAIIEQLNADLAQHWTESGVVVRGEQMGSTPAIREKVARIFTGMGWKVEYYNPTSYLFREAPNAGV